VLLAPFGVPVEGVRRGCPGTTPPAALKQRRRPLNSLAMRSLWRGALTNGGRRSSHALLKGQIVGSYTYFRSSPGQLFSAAGAPIMKSEEEGRGNAFRNYRKLLE